MSGVEGAGGACVSMVTASALEAALVPPALLAVAVILWTPSVNDVVVIVQPPELFAVVDPTWVVPS
jgi:hypothetical protein